MPKKIAVLHTSLVSLNVEPIVADLLAEILPDAEVMHFVDSDVLATVMKEQCVGEASVSRMTHLARAAEDAGADVIFSACSSLGPAIGVARRSVRVPIVKIDDGMTRRAVEQANRIGVLATVPTTLGPTADLIEQKARAIGKEIAIVRELSEGAFQALVGGDKAHHDRTVIESALRLAPRVELMVLAQASTARLAPVVSERTSLPVLSSPRLGVENLKQVLEAEPAHA